MSSAPLTQTEIADRLRNENLDEWLELWWATQGTAKRSALELMAAILPFPIEEKLSVLDLCCGPGDVGRVIRSRFSIARIDCVDRDPFLLSLCAALNTRVGIEGEIFTRDMWKPDWSVGQGSRFVITPRTRLCGLDSLCLFEKIEALHCAAFFRASWPSISEMLILFLRSQISTSCDVALLRRP